MLKCWKDDHNSAPKNIRHAMIMQRSQTGFHDRGDGFIEGMWLRGSYVFPSLLVMKAASWSACNLGRE
jgi:hypothetical protein